MLTIEKSVENKKEVFTLTGRLDTVTAPELEDALKESLENAEELVLDFEKLDYISSAGLRVLLTFEQEMEEQEKTLEVTHVNDIIHDVFDVTGFLDILTIV